MRTPAGRLWLVLAAVPILGACEQAPLMPDQCNIRLALVSPDPATLMVGQELTLEAQLTASPECLPADARPGSLRWASEDTGIATTDAVSGRVRAIRAGTTQVSLKTTTTHTLLTTSEIQVVEP
jgi:hypothetical protein